MSKASKTKTWSGWMVFMRTVAGSEHPAAPLADSQDQAWRHLALFLGVKGETQMYGFIRGAMDSGYYTVRRVTISLTPKRAKK